MDLDKAEQKPDPVRIEVFVETDLIEIDGERFLDVARELLKQESPARLSGTVTLIFSDHDRVTHLNRLFLNHDFDTDVLAFELADHKSSMDAEVYVDVETAIERCEEFKTSVQDEVIRYAIHGLLHLVGYEDKSEGGRDEMKAREQLFLDLWRGTG